MTRLLCLARCLASLKPLIDNRTRRLCEYSSRIIQISDIMYAKLDPRLLSQLTHLTDTSLTSIQSSLINKHSGKFRLQHSDFIRNHGDVHNLRLGFGLGLNNISRPQPDPTIPNDHPSLRRGPMPRPNRLHQHRHLAKHDSARPRSSRMHPTLISAGGLGIRREARAIQASQAFFSLS